QHARVADLVGDPDVGRRAREDAGATTDLQAAVTGDVPVDADAGRPERGRIGQLAGLILHAVPGLVAEGETVGRGVGEGRVAELGEIDAQAVGYLQAAAGLPLVLGVDARVPGLEGLHRLVEARDIHPADLEGTQ